MSAAIDGKRRAWLFGRHAEALCVWTLRLKGYRIMARGFRTPVGELDIVARRGGTLAVVEVKARGDLRSAAEALDRYQRKRILNATKAWLAAHPGDASRAVRFDLMLVRPGRLPVHLENAWREGD